MVLMFLLCKYEKEEGFLVKLAVCMQNVTWCLFHWEQSFSCCCDWRANFVQLCNSLHVGPDLLIFFVIAFVLSSFQLGRSNFCRQDIRVCVFLFFCKKNKKTKNHPPLFSPQTTSPSKPKPNKASKHANKNFSVTQLVHTRRWQPIKWTI